MLEVSGLYKSYGKQQILNDVAFTVQTGACAGIIGSNGCGKTTLLSILAGALKADRGSIRYDGKEAVGAPAVFAAAAAYVPQENPLMEELSARDNLSLWYRGSKKELEKDLVSGTGAMLGISGMLKKPVAKMSGGMKKRLSIACALSNHASTLILDEPGAALDLECKADIRAYLQRYRKAGGTVIMTSHEMEELSMCTELYLLKDGRLCPVKTTLSGPQMIELLRAGTC